MTKLSKRQCYTVKDAKLDGQGGELGRKKKDKVKKYLQASE